MLERTWKSFFFVFFLPTTVLPLIEEGNLLENKRSPSFFFDSILNTPKYNKTFWVKLYQTARRKEGHPTNLDELKMAHNKE